jgi:predicted nucleotidyltransferase
LCSVTAVRREGIDGNGLIVTAVGVDGVPVAYRPMLAACVTVLRARLADLVVYVYGSVATRRARQPESDIDLLVVVADQADHGVIDEIAAELSHSHRDIAREVGLVVITLAELWGDDLDGLGGRCFVKHYCVPLDGDDVRPLLAPCPRLAHRGVGVRPQHRCRGGRRRTLPGTGPNR